MAANALADLEMVDRAFESLGFIKSVVADKYTHSPTAHQDFAGITSVLYQLQNQAYQKLMFSGMLIQEDELREQVRQIAAERLLRYNTAYELDGRDKRMSLKEEIDEVLENIRKTEEVAKRLIESSENK